MADDVETFVPFDPAHIPNVVGLFERVQEWAASISGESARVAFYSARDEPAPSPKAATPKKVNPKKMITAQLSERLDTMVLQLQLLSKAGARNYSRSSTRRPTSWSHLVPRFPD